MKLGIIPARYGSTRFPGKPLIKLGDKTMIQRVYEQSKKSNLDEVIVATDDDRILSEVESFGGRAYLTSPEIPSGTDRCVAALDASGIDASVVVNIQGDEPFIDPAQINAILGLLESDQVEIATLVSPARTQKEVSNPNRVKAVLAASGKALYFSRLPIPYVKDNDSAVSDNYFIHLGIYGYKTLALRFLPARILDLTAT
ncbi:MAG: 3-deoxy-manno-octulosonate cytidylyltransferase [Flavobacteriales bacterium]|nr:3-deoxy-manno-octulosonate cytidylyltransferase [Flavobacteriales bacterium]